MFTDWVATDGRILVEERSFRILFAAVDLQATAYIRLKHPLGYHNRSEISSPFI
ncbi:hypothetical protein D1AOALGA4SA_9064 [Olavius algarvensis Delta 1 endosymbiont]|nr:hypothetical protein D1AOALGA4SA_9064 [Olavius algarvensis Delta 1 endosymbiont]